MRVILGSLAYFDEDLELQEFIADTIRRLPPDAADFALERCRFTAVGESAFGMVLPGRIGVGHSRSRSLAEAHE